MGLEDPSDPSQRDCHLSVPRPSPRAPANARVRPNAREQRPRPVRRQRRQPHLQNLRRVAMDHLDVREVPARRRARLHDPQRPLRAPLPNRRPPRLAFRALDGFALSPPRRWNWRTPSASPFFPSTRRSFFFFFVFSNVGLERRATARTLEGLVRISFFFFFSRPGSSSESWTGSPFLPPDVGTGERHPPRFFPFPPAGVAAFLCFFERIFG